jgi:hypothetical protein
MLVHNTVDGHLYQWCIDVDRNQLTGVDLALNLWATVGLELVPGYEASAWLGFGAPKDTPAAIVGMLNREVNAGLADPAIKTRIADLGGTVLAISPAEFGKLIIDETEKWAKVVKFANIKPE